MRYSLLTQIGLIGLSIVIFVTVLKPMFADINTAQNEMVMYKDAVDKAQQFNAKLQELVSTRDSFSEHDMQRLEKLLPTNIDAPKIMKDIESMFIIKNVTVTSLHTSEKSELVQYGQDDTDAQANSDPALAQQDFEVKFFGTYEDLKSILTLAEANETLLEVASIKFGTVASEATASATSDSKGEGDFDFTLVFRAYGLMASVQ